MNKAEDFFQCMQDVNRLKVLSSRSSQERKDSLCEIVESLNSVCDPSTEALQQKINSYITLENLKRKNTGIEKGSIQIASLSSPSSSTRNSNGTLPLSPQTTVIVRRCPSAIPNGTESHSRIPHILHHAKKNWRNNDLRPRSTTPQVGTKGC